MSIQRPLEYSPCPPKLLWSSVTFVPPFIHPFNRNAWAPGMCQALASGCVLVNMADSMLHSTWADRPQNGNLQHSLADLILEYSTEIENCFIKCERENQERRTILKQVWNKARPRNVRPWILCSIFNLWQRLSPLSLLLGWSSTLAPSLLALPAQL